MCLQNEAIENETYLNTLAPDENPITGSSSKAFLADNSMYANGNSNTIFFVFSVIITLGLIATKGATIQDN